MFICICCAIFANQSNNISGFVKDKKENTF